MPTTKPRINLTLPKELNTFLKLAAKRDEMPVATKVIELLHSALEMEEDEYWEQLAASRDTKDAKFVSHEEAWKV
jgi:hypothetical protein